MHALLLAALVAASVPATAARNRDKAAQDLLPDAVVPPGSLSQRRPSANEKVSLARGFAVAKALGAVDVGQAVVVQAGLVLGLDRIHRAHGRVAAQEHQRFSISGVKQSEGSQIFALAYAKLTSVLVRWVSPPIRAPCPSAVGLC